MTTGGNGPKCLNQMRNPEPGTFPYYMGNYVFPVVFSIGVVGNIMNLIVLNKMKTKTVYFLSAIAAADICFFVAMFMINLTAFDSLALNTAFLNFYYQAKMTLLALANWFSSASIWFIIMVTVERLVAIRTPLIARAIWSPQRITAIMITICISTFLLQIPHFLWLKPGTLPDCTHPNKTAHVLVQLNLSDPMYIPLKYAIIICPMITVPIPMILLVSLNGLLVHHMRLSRRHIKELGGLMNQGHSLVNQGHENEIKVAWTILIIVFTFFVFNFPSAVIYVYYLFETNHYRLSKLIIASLITNYMVTVSKALNFPLYCCTSSNFRTQLKHLFGKMCFNDSTWRKLSTDTNFVINSLRKKKYSRQSSSGTNYTKRTSVNSDNGKRTSLNQNSIQNETIIYDEVFTP